MGMVTVRSGSALRVTRTVAELPSATVRAALWKFTVTSGTSSSVMETTVSLGETWVTVAGIVGRVPKDNLTLSVSSSTVSSTAVTAMDVDVSPALKVTAVGMGS